MQRVTEVDEDSGFYNRSKIGAGSDPSFNSVSGGPSLHAGLRMPTPVSI